MNFIISKYFATMYVLYSFSRKLTAPKNQEPKRSNRKKRKVILKHLKMSLKPFRRNEKRDTDTRHRLRQEIQAHLVEVNLEVVHEMLQVVEAVGLLVERRRMIRLKHFLETSEIL